jgi:segregation and condensation protein B
MDINQVESAIEAILFASGDPISVDKLSEVTEVDRQTVYKLCLTLKDKLDKDGRGIAVVELNDSFQMITKAEYAEFIKKALEIKRNAPLSQAAMEVLAIIAYNQPVSKGFIEQVRGVESSQIVNNLVDKGLVEEAGRLEIPGRPISYKTSVNFLRCFGLKTLENLPVLPDDSGQVLLDEVVEGEKEAEKAAERE